MAEWDTKNRHAKWWMVIVFALLEITKNSSFAHLFRLILQNTSHKKIIRKEATKNTMNGFTSTSTIIIMNWIELNLDITYCMRITGICVCRFMVLVLMMREIVVFFFVCWPIWTNFPRDWRWRLFLTLFNYYLFIWGEAKNGTI